MKTLTKSALIGVLLASGVAFAGAPYGGGPGNCHHGAHHAHGFDRHGGGIARMVERLDLTPEQRTTIRGIVDQARPQFRQVRDRMMENRKQLRTLMQQDTYDEAQVRQLAQAQGAAKADMIVLRTKVQSEIRKVLTEQQRDQLKQMRAARGYRG
jgi:protein CpxP